MKRRARKAPPRKVPGVMNGLERKYTDLLNLRKATGQIVGWKYEQRVFTLAPKTTYCPDFEVTLLDGSVEYHETKGFMREDAMVKLKVAAAMNPEYVFRLVKWKKGAWSIKEIPSR